MVSVFFILIIGASNAYVSHAYAENSGAAPIKLRWEWTSGIVTPETKNLATWQLINSLEESPHAVSEVGRIISYRLSIPPLMCDQCVISIHDIYRNYDIYLNGRLFHNFGTINTNTPDSLGNPIERFHLPSQTPIELLIVVKGLKKDVGIYGPVFVGDADELLQTDMRKTMAWLIVVAFTFFASVYNLIVFFPVRWERVELYFSITALISSVYLICRIDLIRWFVDAPVFFDFTEYISFDLMALSCWLYFCEFFLAKQRWATGITLGYSLLIAYITIQTITGSHLPHEYTSIVILLTAFILLLMIVISIFASFKKREHSLFFVGTFGLCILLCLLGLYESVWGNNQFELGPYILLTFVSSQLYLLSSRSRQLNKTLNTQTIELEQKNQDLIKLDKVKDEFLAMTSHELRTPLNGIIGLSESLIEGAAGPINRVMRDNLQMIMNSGKRLANLVNDILDISQMRIKGIQLKRAPLHIRNITDLVSQALQPVLREQVTLINSIELGTPEIYGDNNRLQQVLYNLFGNAMKFTHIGSISVWTTWDTKSVHLHIKDTGIGIATEKQETIFQPFEQADYTIERRYGGNGLGLSISKQLIELHDGTIKLNSKLGVGSEFIISLPRADHYLFKK